MTSKLFDQEEVEELTALYDSEKSQNLALEEAVAAEKENFNKVRKKHEKTNQILGEIRIF